MGSRRIALVTALAASSVLILATALQWELADWLTPFGLMPFQGTIWLGSVGVALWVTIRSVHDERRRLSTYLPALVCALTITVVLFVPFTPLWLKANFAWYRDAREDVVRKVGIGTLLPNVSHNPSLVALGNDGRKLSMGGNQIVVERHDGVTYVFFFTFRGILDNYAGFLFVPQGGDPARFGDLHEPQTELMQLNQTWWFASHR